MELNLFNIVNTIYNIEKEINNENLKHKEKIKELNKKMEDFIEFKNLIMNGIDIEKYINAKKFIYIEGYDNIGYGDTISKLKEFENDIGKKNFKIKITDM